VSGMEFLGVDPLGIAHFGTGMLRIFDMTGDFLTASYTHVELFSDPNTDNSVLFGDLNDLTFNFGRISRFVTEFSLYVSDNPHTSFYLETNGNLATATNNYTTDGSVDGIESTFGGDNQSVPEPTTLTLLGIGAISLLGYGWWQSRQENAEGARKRDMVAL